MLFRSLDDAKSLQKKQYTSTQYQQLMDIKDGYSKVRMLEIMKDRATYLMARGSTLNNPHIPLSYFDGWVRIEENHADELRALVSSYLIEKEATT